MSPYGNYVIQKCLTLAETKEHELICCSVFKLIPQITDKKLR